MAAPVADKIVLPTDAANAGKKVRTQTRTVGADSVHEHFYVPSQALTIVGKYVFSPAQATVSATVQDGTATGFWWLQLPAAATVTAFLRRITAQANAGSALATPTAPVLSFTKFTFTGTASGGTIAVLPTRTGLTTNQMIVRSALTGMTITKVAELGNFFIPSAETAVGQYWANTEVLAFNPLAFQRGDSFEIGPGEGLAIFQSVAATASDTRKFGVRVEWDEVDLS